MYVMFDFICKCELELRETRVQRELQNEKILAHCRIRTRDIPLTKRARYHYATRTDVCEVDKR